MGCPTKTKFSCPDFVYAECTKYEGEVNSQSALAEQSCYSIEETTQDIYNQLDYIDVRNIDNELDYDTTESGDIVIKNVAKKHAAEIVTIKQDLETVKQTAFLDLNITNLGLDFACLQTQCETDIQTVKDLFQALINRICD